MQGILKLVKVQDVGLPIANIRMCGADLSGKERNIILEYELPVNFKIQDMNSTFVAVQIQKGEFLGFLFASDQDKSSFTTELKKLQTTLAVDSSKLGEIKKTAEAKANEEFNSQMTNIKSENIENLFEGTNLDQQAKDLRNLLLMAGVDLNSALQKEDIAKVM